jgi:hypothetical protein
MFRRTSGGIVVALLGASVVLSAVVSPGAAYAGDRGLVLAADVEPDDPWWDYQIESLPAITLPEAWSLTTGSSAVTIAVVDTGVTAIGDLAGVVLPGYDVVNNVADASDNDGHGTAIASIIAARGNNGEGMAGACWSCRILPVKVRDSTFGTDSSADLAAGIIYAADHDASIINVSLTGYAPDAVLRDAVAYAQRQGAVVVAAVGDQAVTAPEYPAAFDGVIGVGATWGGDRFEDSGWDGTLYGSNYGPDWVDVGAPWWNVILELSGFANDTGGVDVGNDDYYTSFATTEGSAALVSGTLGLMKSAAPNADSAALVAGLTSTAEQTRRPGFAYGEIRAGAAVAAVDSVDGTAPKVTGALPAQGTRFRGKVTLTATGVSDSGSGVAYAGLYANGKLVGKDSTAPYAVTYASGASNGNVAFQWRVFDKAGNSAVFNRTLIADNKAPTVKVTKAPANGAKVKGTVTVKAAASDASGIARVELIVNGKVVARDAASPYVFKIKVAKYGKKIKVQVRAVDKVGNTTTTTARTWKR